MKGIVYYLLSMTMLAIIVGCSCNNGSDDARDKDSTQLLPDTLRVATLYSPSSYFIYRDAMLGYDYSLVTEFAKDHNVEIDVIVAPNMSEMIKMVETGEADLIAYEVPITSEYKNRVIPCGMINYNYQVLVQPKKGDKVEITDVTQLVGKDIYVEPDSKYLQRIENLNKELGGGINIHIVEKDTIITEDLIAMVANGDIPLTIVDSDIARVNKTYYENLDISLQLSFKQRSSWCVSLSSQWLADIINKWVEKENPKRKYAEVHRKYFELSKTEKRPYTMDFSKGYISDYDAYFKKYANIVNWDWRILAAQAYTESRFDSTAVSWAGARGIMQLMPETAKSYGLSLNKIERIDDNVKAATQVLKKLDSSLSKIVENPDERQKFVLAAYNSGIGHIYDAIALAEKYGMDPQKWDGNVAEAVLMKTQPQYYNDPVCKYGYFQGTQTYEYVNKVMDFYRKCKRKVPL